MNSSKLICKKCGHSEFVNLLSFPAFIPSGRTWHKVTQDKITYYFCSESCKDEWLNPLDILFEDFEGFDIDNWEDIFGS